MACSVVVATVFIPTRAIYASYGNFLICSPHQILRNLYPLGINIRLYHAKFYLRLQPDIATERYLNHFNARKLRAIVAGIQSLRASEVIADCPPRPFFANFRILKCCPHGHPNRQSCRCHSTKETEHIFPKMREYILHVGLTKMM